MRDVGCQREVWCDVIVWVMQNILKWFDHVDRIDDDRLVQKINREKVEGNSERKVASILGRESERIYCREDLSRCEGDGAC